MKKITTCLCLLLVCCLMGFAQESSPAEKSSVLKIPTFVKKLSLTASMGTRGFSPAEVNQISVHAFKQINLGELGISYRLNSRFSVGLITMGSLGNCDAGYLNDESGFVSFADELDDDDDMDDPDDPDDIDDDNDVDDDCGEDELGRNVMGTFTFVLSERLPLFIQGAAGYTFSKKAPAYSALVGYRQQLFAGLQLRGGFRYSDVLYSKPAGATSLFHTSAIRPEIGLVWNFD